MQVREGLSKHWYRNVINGCRSGILLDYSRMMLGNWHGTRDFQVASGSFRGSLTSRTYLLCSSGSDGPPRRGRAMSRTGQAHFLLPKRFSRNPSCHVALMAVEARIPPLYI